MLTPATLDNTRTLAECAECGEAVTDGGPLVRFPGATMHIGCALLAVGHDDYADAYRRQCEGLKAPS